jgi:hypothetical protein
MSSTAVLGTALVGSLLGAGVMLNGGSKQVREQPNVRTKVDDDEQPNQKNAYHSERYYDTWNVEFANATKAFLKAQDPQNENVVPLYYNQMSLRQQQSPELQNYLLKRGARVSGLEADQTNGIGLRGSGTRETFINERGADQSAANVHESPMFRPLGFPEQSDNIAEMFTVSTNSAAHGANDSLSAGTRISKQEHFQSYTVHGPANSNNPGFTNNMVPFAKKFTQNMDPDAFQSRLEAFTGQTNDVTEFRSQPHREIPSLQDRTPGQTFIYGTPADLATTAQLDRYITSNLKTSVTPFQQIRVGRGISPDSFEAAPRDGFHPWFRPTERTVDDLRVNPKNQYGGRLLPGQERVQNRGFSGEVFKQRPDRFTPMDQRRWNRTTGSFTAAAIRENFDEDMKCQSRSSTNIAYVGPAGNRENLGARPGVYQEGSDIDHGGACVGGELGVDGRINDDMRDGTLYGGIPYRVQRPNSDDLLNTTNDVNELASQGSLSCNGPNNTNGCTLSARVQHTLRNQLKSEPYRNLIGDQEQSTMRPYDKARPNIRDTTNVRDYMGQAHSSDLEQSTMRPFDKTRANMRDTTNVRDYMGQVQSGELEQFTTRPYDKTRANIRDTTNVRDYMGQVNAGELEQPIVRPYDKTRANIRDTTNVRDYMGQVNAGELEQPIVRPYDKTRANIRDTTNVRDYVGISSAEAGNQKPRKYLEDKARSNTRATLAVRDYVGGAGSVQTRQPVSYEAMYNATSNNNSESLLESRAYGPNKATNVANGACDVNIQIRSRTGYDITRYGPNETKQYQAIPTIDGSFDATTSRNLRDMPGARQPEDFAVEQFRRNPYSQDLDSSTPMTTGYRRGEIAFSSPQCTPDTFGTSSTPISSLGQR